MSKMSYLGFINYHLIAHMSSRRHFKVGAQVFLEKTFEDWEPGCLVLCNNGNCNMVHSVPLLRPRSNTHTDAQRVKSRCCLYCVVCLLVHNPQHWGHEMKYKKVLLLPRLVIKNFALETPEGRQTPKKWKNVNFIVEPFDFKEYCEDNFEHLFD